VTLAQLATQSPILLACLVGIILAAVFWGRYPAPCLLTLLAAGLLLVVTVAHTVLVQYLYLARADQNWSDAKLASMLFTVGLTCNLFRGLALGLLFVAVFLGRSTTRWPETNLPVQSTTPAVRLSDDPGFTSRPGD
jgi:hypothetical protein